jgi:pimeloyl-ACP methyl ester carboxylesterase
VTQTPPLPVRRGFVDIADGQMHYRASGLGAAGGAPLICLHQSPFSSLTYLEILPLLGARRPTVALDTPGFGESFRPRAKPTISDYASWLREAALALGFERFDVMGLFTGAATASDMAVRFPDQVRRLILMGPPLFDAAQQAKYLAEAWPPRPRPDGSHFLPEWRRVMERALPDVPFERRCDAFHEFWRGGGDAIWGEEAVSVYPLKETLPRITQPTLVIQPDGILGHAETASGLIPNAHRIRLEGVRGWSMMQTAPERVAEAANAFLDAGA